VKKHIMTGLVMLLPLALTFWIVSFLFHWLTEPFIGIAEGFLRAVGLKGVPFFFMTSEQAFFWLSRLLVLVFLVLFILLVGVVGRYVVFKYLIRAGDIILHRIPVISSVYKTSQELIQTILSSDTRAFKQVVLVPFPHNECWTIGLVAREAPNAFDRIPVFVPTTPNPTSGYLVMYERSKVKPLQLSIEEAFRYVISAGALLPDPSRLQNASQPPSEL
jgi:uncharacterized membrane protein